MASTFVHPVTGQTLRMGRKRPAPASHVRRLALASYAAPTPVPDRTTYSAVAQPCLDQILLNDELSCCTASTAFHVAGLVLGNAGTAVRFSNAQVEAFYALSTGYDPRRPSTDQGGDEITVLEAWRAHGLEKALHGIAGHLVVDAANTALVKRALATFGNLYCGAEMPGDWLRAAPGSVLPVGGEPLEENGHAFAGLRYDPDGIELCLWGGVQVMLPWAGAAKYLAPRSGGELHVVVSRDALNVATHRDLHGLDWAGLASDFRALGGKLA